jgi:hypothetical protein
MTAAEVLAEHGCDENGFRCYGCDWALEKHVSVNDGTEHGAHQLEMLMAAGYAVVELPEPDAIASDQYHYWDNQDVLCHPGDGVGYYKVNELRAVEMRQLGLALLAAADVAEMKQ